MKQESKQVQVRMDSKLYAALEKVADAESNSIACVLRRLAAAGLEVEQGSRTAAEGS